MIKQVVAKLIKQHKTNDPLEVAALKNITVLYSPLGSTLGFYSTYKRSKYIHINSDLDYPMQKFVCAHELGHAVLHSGINTPFLKANTFYSTIKLEREANEFAVELLLPDEVVGDYQTIFEAAAACGVPEEIVTLKRLNGNCLWKFWYDERSYFSV